MVNFKYQQLLYSSMATNFEDSFTYSNPAEWFDSICGSKHKINLKQIGNRIEVKLNAFKDYEWIRWGNFKKGKWNPVKQNHSMRVKIKDAISGEYLIGDFNQGRLVKAGDENTFVWEAPYATDYEIEWVENSTGDCKGINNYVGSKRITVSSEDIQTQEDRETQNTKEMIDTVGGIVAGTLSLTLLYSIYRFMKK